MKLPVNPRDRVLLAVAAGAVIAACVVVLCWQLWQPAPIASAYFTTDDGATFFPLPGYHYAPFDFNGSQAVQAMVYEGSDGNPFVAFLMKYTPEGKQTLESAGPDGASVDMKDTLYKRPGEKDWFPSNSPQAEGIWNATDPNTHAPAKPWTGT